MLHDGRVEIEHLPAARRHHPTLIFLHEGLGSISQWRDFPAQLALRTGCGALIYSRFGYGGSDPVRLPRPLHYMRDEAFVLSELLERTDISDHILVGHSDGGTIALLNAACAAQPGLLGVITEAAHVFCEAKTVAAIERARVDFTTGRLRTALVRHHGANTDNAFFGWCDAWLDAGLPQLGHTARNCVPLACQCWRCREPTTHTEPNGNWMQFTNRRVQARTFELYRIAVMHRTATNSSGHSTRWRRFVAASRRSSRVIGYATAR